MFRVIVQTVAEWNSPYPMQFPLDGHRSSAITHTLQRGFIYIPSTIATTFRTIPGKTHRLFLVCIIKFPPNLQHLRNRCHRSNDTVAFYTSTIYKWEQLSKISSDAHFLANGLSTLNIICKRPSNVFFSCANVECPPPKKRRDVNCFLAIVKTLLNWKVWSNSMILFHTLF